MSCGTEIAWYDNVPLLSYSCCAAAAARAGADRRATRGRARDGGARRRLRPRVRPHVDAARRGVLLRRARRRHRDRPRAPDRPEPDRRCRPRSSSSSRRRRSTRAPSGRSAHSAPRVPASSPRSPIPAGMGMGDVKLALLIGARSAGRSPVALLLGMFAALVPGRPARPPRARAPARWRSRSRPSSRSAASSRSSRATRCSTPIWRCSRPLLQEEPRRLADTSLEGSVPETANSTAASPPSARGLAAARRLPRCRLGVTLRGARRRPRRVDRPAPARPARARPRRRAKHGSLAQALVDEGLARRGLARPSPPGTACRSSTSARGRRLTDGGLARCRSTSSSGSSPCPYALEDEPLRRDRRSREHPRDRRAPARDAAPDRARASPRARTSSRSSARLARSRGVQRRARRGHVELGRGRATTRDDLEADDGISDAPLVRLVNSIIFEAAEDGASDVHFEPQEDALVVRVRIDGVLHEVQRIPKRIAPASPPASRCSRSSTSPSAASRRTAASRSTPPRPDGCSTSASRRCRRSRASRS